MRLKKKEEERENNIVMIKLQIVGPLQQDKNRSLPLNTLCSLTICIFDCILSVVSILNLISISEMILCCMLRTLIWSEIAVRTHLTKPVPAIPQPSSEVSSWLRLETLQKKLAAFLFSTLLVWLSLTTFVIKSCMLTVSKGLPTLGGLQAR